MIALAVPLATPFSILRGRLECWAIGLALLYYSGAVWSQLLLDPDSLMGGNQRLVQALALPAYLLTLLVAARYRGALVAALRQNPALAMLLFLLPFLSVLWSITPSVSLRRAVALGFSMLLAYLIAVRFTPRQFLVLVMMVLGVAMVLSLLLAAVAPGQAAMPPGHVANGLRGVFNHKNVLGWHAGVAAIASGLVAADRRLGLRPLAVVFFLASIACLLLSRSATGLMLAAAGGFFALFYTALAKGRRMGRIVLILLTLQIAMLLSLFTTQLLGLMLEGTEKDVTLTGRVPLWALVDTAISQRPLLGYGYQAFWTAGSGEAWTIWFRVGWMAPHAHNGYRDTMLSLGLFGIALLLLVIVQVLRRGAILHCHHPREGWLWPNVLICVFLVMNLTESLLLTQNSFLFIIFAAALVSLSGRRPPA